ncbi:MAG: universal stress protein [Myxococcales bacterium]|nr:universal stress protein [Myxococcales bacterium]
MPKFGMMLGVKRILVPVDYSEPSREVLAFAAEIASKLGGSLTVVHVWECMPHAPPDLKVKGRDGKLRKLGDVIRDNAETEMRQFLAASALPKGLRVTTRVESGEAAKRILEDLESGEFDLLVMGTHGRGGVKHFVLGSVAEKIVRNSRLPVITVPARRESAD